MIIIEGKSGKSRKLEEILKTLETNECKNIYMFDRVKIPFFNVERLITYTHLDIDYELLLDWSKISLGKYIDDGYIVFEYNVPIEMKDEFINMGKHWDQESYIDKIILTVQNNNLKDIKVYEV